MSALVAAHLLANGYVIGIYDQAIHLVFLKRAMTPEFLRGDLLADAAGDHLSAFWTLQAPLLRHAPLEPTYFALHLISLVLMFCGALALTKQVSRGENPRAPWIAALLAAITANSFGWVSTMDALVLNRTVVAGAELFVIALAFQDRLPLSLLLAGLLCNLHVTTAFQSAFVAGCVGLCGRQSPRRLALSAALFGVGASPLLVSALSASAQPHLLTYDDWRSIVTLAWPFHHFIRWIGLRDEVSLLLHFVIVAATARQLRSPKLMGAAVAVILLCLGNFFLTEVLHSRLGTMMHLYESSRFLTYLGFASVAILVTSRRPEAALDRALSLLLLVCVAAHAAFSEMKTPDGATYTTWGAYAGIATVVIILLRKPVARERATQTDFGGALVIGIAFIVFAHVVRQPDLFLTIEGSLHYERLERFKEEEVCAADKPHGDISGAKVMSWSKDNLPTDAVVVLPPVMLSGLASFRSVAERSALVTMKDGGEATFGDRFATTWRDRMTALTQPAPPATDDTSFGGWLGRQGALKSAFCGADDAHFRSLEERFGATHLLCPAGAHCWDGPWPRVYEDPSFRIFKLVR